MMKRPLQGGGPESAAPDDRRKTIQAIQAKLIHCEAYLIKLRRFARLISAVI